MEGIIDAMPNLHLVRRVITRAPGLGGEDYDAVAETEFSKMTQNSAFSLHWRAHGLCYGIPISVMDHLKNGTDCLANFSRNALTEADSIFPKLVVLNITATPDTLAKRLADRGRETDEEIACRIAVSSKPLPDGFNVIELSNDGPLSETIARAVACLQPVKS